MAEGVGPDSDSCEQVDLGVSHKLGWNDVLDVTFVYNSWCNVACVDKVPQPLGGEGLDFIVKCGQLLALTLTSGAA